MFSAMVILGTTALGREGRDGRDEAAMEGEGWDRRHSNFFLVSGERRILHIESVKILSYVDPASVPSIGGSDSYFDET